MKGRRNGGSVMRQGAWQDRYVYSLSIEQGKNDILLIAWIGRGSHGCGDVGKGASGGVSREIETMG